MMSVTSIRGAAMICAFHKDVPGANLLPPNSYRMVNIGKNIPRERTNDTRAVAAEHHDAGGERRAAAVAHDPAAADAVSLRARNWALRVPCGIRQQQGIDPKFGEGSPPLRIVLTVEQQGFIGLDR
jgi:hypothetical protein